jgi:hypothetical protein
MKVKIEAESQTEFEAKKEAVSKMLSNDYGKVRRAIYPAQNEIFDYWDRKFKGLIQELKNEILSITKKQV